MSALQRPTEFFTSSELRHLRHIDVGKSLWSLVHCWGVIVLTWVVVSTWTNPLTILLGVMIVGTRQLGLFVLTHDAAHFALFKDRKINDWVAQWILNRAHTDASVHAYRTYHMAHHLHTQQKEDPDLELSAPFPISKASFLRKVMRDLTGQTGLKQYRRLFSSAFSGNTYGERLKSAWMRLGPNMLINVFFLSAFSILSAWYLYFFLWFLPSLTWYRLVVRLRNIAEHASVESDDDRLKNTRTTKANWIERAFIAPYNVHYHLEHHLVVNCPQYNLPLAHQMLVGKGYLPRMEVQSGYPAVLRLAVS